VLSVLLLVAAATVPIIFRTATSSSTGPATSTSPVTPSSTPDVTATSRQAPLVQTAQALAPIVVAALRLLLESLWLIATPFAALARGILVVLQPLILVVNATVYVFVLAPCNALNAVGAFLYPLWSFAMVAVIVGLLGGLFARGIVRILTSLVAGDVQVNAQAKPRVRRKKLA